MENFWVVSFIDNLRKAGKLQSYAREGFLDLGRGALYMPTHEGERIYYLPRSGWANLNFDTDRLKAVFRGIDEYNPLSEAVVVVVSTTWDDKFEITTCKIKF